MRDAGTYAQKCKDKGLSLEVQAIGERYQKVLHRLKKRVWG